jgi:DNA-binding transcriptional MerR regulator
MKHSVYKIGEVAKLLGTSIRTIRYYEEALLLTPIRTDKGTRLYADAHIERLKAILDLAKIGLSIESIREISQARESASTGNESSHKVSQLFDIILSDLDKKIEEIDKMKKEINSAKAVVKRCNNCNNYPSTKDCPNCPVRLQLSEIKLLNLVWDTD